MSENNCAVYVHVNLINGKKYFGITTREPEKRWKNGNGYHGNAHFMNAIKKYGWENFAHYVLFKNIPVAIAKNIEEFLIQEHFSYDPRFGYNKTRGGEHEIPSEETRRKMSEAHKGNVLGEETRKAKSKAMKEYYKNHPETRKAKSKALSKSVEALDPETGHRVFCFDSTISAERAGLGFDCAHISKCCNRKPGFKTHKGYIWRWVVEEVNDNDGNN